jgi:uncharacterized protein (TIGR02284 family)
MLRDDRQVALNEVILICQEVADRYQAAAEMLEESELSRLIWEFSRQRQNRAKQLREHVRRLGDLPRMPDPDKKVVDNLITRVRSVLSADERLTLLEECEQDEHRIAERIAIALQEDLPEAALGSVDIL